MSEISLFRISNKVIFTKKNEKAVKLPKRQVSGRFFFFPGGKGGEMGRNFRAEPAVSDVPMPPGYLTVSVLTFVSVLFLALPVGIIGHECLGVF